MSSSRHNSYEVNKSKAMKTILVTDFNCNLVTFRALELFNKIFSMIHINSRHPTIALRTISFPSNEVVQTPLPSLTSDGGPDNSGDFVFFLAFNGNWWRGRLFAIKRVLFERFELSDRYDWVNLPIFRKL